MTRIEGEGIYHDRYGALKVHASLRPNVRFDRPVITYPGHISEPGLMKKKSTTSPHDATFRQFLTQPDIARDFMEIHLPAELRAICDLSTLKLESGSFVEDGVLCRDR